MLSCGELPKGTRVVVLPSNGSQTQAEDESATIGTVQSFL